MRFNPISVWALVFLVAGLGLVASGGVAQNRAAKVTVWHYFGAGPGTALFEQFAAEFNKAQSKVEILPQDAGSFQDIQVKTIAGLRAGGLPSAAIVDNAFFTRLALSNQLADFDEQAKALPLGVLNDFYPVLWDYGAVDVGGGVHRYGLPWLASTVIFYDNVDALASRGLQAPRSWEEFGRVARALSSRVSKGAVMFTNAWIFGSIVSSRGGSLLTPDKKPDFDSPVALETLKFLSDLTKAGAIQPRSANEAGFAVLDFLRTKVMMVIVPTSAYPATSQASFAFKIGAFALPGRTIAGEAQLVAFKGTPLEAQKGLFDFWQYLMRPENLARFDRETYYLPIRKSAVRLLGDVGQSVVMKAGLEGLERAYNLPHLIEFQDWRPILEDQLERCLKGGVDPARALMDAQRATGK